MLSHFTSIAGKAREFVVDNSPMILTGMAVAGVVTTTILAVKNTPRAYMDVQHAESEREEPLTNVEKAKLTYHYYLPAAVAGSLTIGAIIMAHSVNSRRQAAFISAYTIADNRYREYQKKVAETVGPNKEQQIHDDVAQDIVNRNVNSDRDVFITGTGKVWTYDPMTDRLFEADMQTLQQAEIDTNYQILNDGYASLNDYYSNLGIPTVSMGEDLGWTSDQKLDVRITTTTAEGRPCFCISFVTDPFPKYHRIH